MKNILIIEANSINARQYRSFFMQHGYSVYATSGAGEAVVLADKHKIDLVILELQLKGHGGVEFLHEFRSYKDFAQIPIILYTIVPPDRLPTDELKTSFGVRHILYKPTSSLKTLLHVVKQALSE